MTTLTIPLPPSWNEVVNLHHMALHRRKKAYQKTVWACVVQQDRPSRDPPQYITVSAVFYVHNLRDEDGLVASLKWALDALRQRQRGSLGWRQGLYDQCGYMVDDPPKNMTLGDVTQMIDRKAKRLVITIEETP